MEDLNVNDSPSQDASANQSQIPTTLPSEVLPETTEEQRENLLDNQVSENSESEIALPQTPLNDENENAKPTNSVGYEAEVKQDPINRLNSLSAVLQKCREAIFDRKQKKLEKILKFAKQKTLRPDSGPMGITNDEVQKLILVSDKTAERYLQELVKQGKLRKVGSTSQIYYELLN